MRAHCAHVSWSMLRKSTDARLLSVYKHILGVMSEPVLLTLQIVLEFQEQTGCCKETSCWFVRTVTPTNSWKLKHHTTVTCKNRLKSKWFLLWNTVHKGSNQTCCLLCVWDGLPIVRSTTTYDYYEWLSCPTRFILTHAQYHWTLITMSGPAKCPPLCP